MTSNELKSEIQKALNNIPDDILQEVLLHLKNIEGQSQQTLDLSRDLKKILKEDCELLERLAQ